MMKTSRVKSEVRVSSDALPPLGEGGSEIDVILFDSEQKTAPGKATVISWTRDQRLKRAMKALGIAWSFSLVSIFIPGAHFILVPAFFVSGPFVAYWVYGAYRMISGGSGICPHCQSEFSIEKSPLKWPIDDLCTRCQASIKIIPKSDFSQS